MFLCSYVASLAPSLCPLKTLIRQNSFGRKVTPIDNFIRPSGRTSTRQSNMAILARWVYFAPGRTFVLAPNCNFIQVSLFTLECRQKEKHISNEPLPSIPVTPVIYGQYQQSFELVFERTPLYVAVLNDVGNYKYVHIYISFFFWRNKKLCNVILLSITVSSIFLARSADECCCGRIMGHPVRTCIRTLAVRRANRSDTLKSI